MKEAIVSAKWLNENLNSLDLVILDASQKDNKAGLKTESGNIRIKGARFFDIEMTFSNKDSSLPNMLPDPKSFETECRKLGLNRSSKIVVYDKLGIYSSPRVWWMFKAMGHENIAVLDGGLPAWKAEGFEVESPQREVFGSGDFEANFKPDKVKDIEFVKDNLEKQPSVIVDARSENRFKGIAPEPRKGLRGGHIPGSVNIPFQSVLDDGKYKSKAELTNLFERFDFDEKPLVFSCGSGITACIVLLASELVLNNPKSVYDGSWTEWALQEDLPIE